MSTIDELMMGEATRKVSCECGWSNDGRLIIVDRYATDFPPIPRGNGLGFLEIYRDDGMDPDDRVSECPCCGEFLDPVEVLERMAA